MRADIHGGPEQKVQSEAGYIDARPQTDSSTKTSCNARPDHTWWVNPGVFDTREWSGDVRVGGQWRASGIARGEAYALEGKFLEVDPPRKLVQTWHFAGAPGTPSTGSYLLEAVDGGTRLRGGRVLSVKGRMCCSVSGGGGLMDRVGADAYQSMLAEPHIVLGGRTMTG